MVQIAVSNKSAVAGASDETVKDAFINRMEQINTPENISMDLIMALSLGSEFSRSLQTRREELYLAGVDALAARRNASFRYSGTVDFILKHASEKNDETSGTAKLTASKLLPTGGKVGMRAGVSGLDVSGNTNTSYKSYAGIDIEQPLLSGAGYEASHSALIKAERNLIYAIRSFSLNRQDFAVQILKTYYNLLSSKAVVSNTEKNLEQAKFLRERSEALFKIRKATALDVMRSQQQELSALNRLEQVRANFD
ncbi:MAG: TolC family protein, partial [Lentisphaerae bacterium]|nr:TolC family protein [Lentisphaerota bacterium]